MYIIFIDEDLIFLSSLARLIYATSLAYLLMILVFHPCAGLSSSMVRELLKLCTCGVSFYFFLAQYPNDVYMNVGCSELVRGFIVILFSSVLSLLGLTVSFCQYHLG